MADRDWSESELYVRETLKGLVEKVDEIQENVSEIKADLASHKVKSGFWGALSGIAVTISARMFGGH